MQTDNSKLEVRKGVTCAQKCPFRAQRAFTPYSPGTIPATPHESHTTPTMVRSGNSRLEETPETTCQSQLYLCFVYCYGAGPKTPNRTQKTLYSPATTWALDKGMMQPTDNRHSAQCLYQRRSLHRPGVELDELARHLGFRFETGSAISTVRIQQISCFRNRDVRQAQSYRRGS